MSSGSGVTAERLAEIDAQLAMPQPEDALALELREALTVLEGRLAEAASANEAMDAAMDAAGVAAGSLDKRVARMLQEVRDYDTVTGELRAAEGRLAEATEALRWLRRGMELARYRHLHNAHQAAEAITAWTLNGNDPDEWTPRAGDFGVEDEARFRALIRHNRDIRAITAAAHDNYLPREALRAEPAKDPA